MVVFIVFDVLQSSASSWMSHFGWLATIIKAYPCSSFLHLLLSQCFTGVLKAFTFGFGAFFRLLDIVDFFCPHPKFVYIEACCDGFLRSFSLIPAVWLISLSNFLIVKVC